MSEPTTEAPAAALALRVLTPEQVVYEGAVRWVEVLLPDGLIGIWPGHAPLIARTASGPVRYGVGERLEQLNLGDGLLRVSHGECVILVSAPGSAGHPATSEDVADVRDNRALMDDLTDALEETLTGEERQALQEP